MSEMQLGFWYVEKASTESLRDAHLCRFICPSEGPDRAGDRCTSFFVLDVGKTQQATTY